MLPVAIDTIAAERAIAALNHAVRLLEPVRRAVADELLRGELDGEGGTLRLLDELVEELSLAARSVLGTAEAAIAADALAASLTDGIGTVPVDLPDPMILTRWLDPDQRVGWAHFGHLPLFGSDGVPRPDDVRQGALGDCYLLAALAALAHEHPGAIRRLITDHGNGTYTVHLPTGDVTVDDQLPVVVDEQLSPTYAQPAPSGALWPAIIEKAAAVASGGSYEMIDGLVWPGNSFDLISTTAGSIGRIREPALEDGDVDALQAAVEQGRPAVALSSAGFGMGGAHAWTVVAVTGTGSSTRVTLRNPWGHLGMERDDDGDVVYDEDDDGVDGTEVIPGDADDELVFTDPASPYIEVPADVFADQFYMVDVSVAGLAPPPPRS